MTEFVVAIGSNIDPSIHVPEILSELNAAFGFHDVAPIVETPPIDRPEQGPYWNTCVALSTLAGKVQVEEMLRQMEAAHGRIRTPDKFAARTMDLDIIVWDGAVVDEDVSTRPFLQDALRALGVPF